MVKTLKQQALELHGILREHEKVFSDISGKANSPEGYEISETCIRIHTVEAIFKALDKL